MKPSTEWWRYLAPLAVIAIIALLPVPAGLENHTWLYFAVFTGVIVGLILEPVPGAVVAMVGISIIAILSPWLLFSLEQLAQPGFKFTAKSLSWAVSGFSNSVIWLIFAAFMFSTGYEKTGLGRRIALILVKKMGHRTLFLGYAVMFSELILAPVTPSNSARGAGIIYPIIRNLPPLYQSQPNDSSSRSIGSYIMWMGIVADCVTSAIFLTAMAPNLLLIGLMKSASHATLSWGDWFLGMLPLSILLVLLVPWMAYVLYPPVLKSGDQVPRWAETELQAMGPLCSREKRMLGLMVGALVLWIFGGDYIDAAMVGYSVVALMLLLRIICWDDIVSNKAAWNVFFWLASLITLATGLNNTGFISWFGKLLAGSLSGYSPTMVMVALIVVFYLLRYFFASATAYTSALAPMMIAAALAMPEIPLPVFCLMVGAAIGLGSILTPYATGPSPIYYGSGYLPTADYWRLGAIFGLIFLVLLVITGLLWMPVVLL
ncbi:L-tartrate/succinate antiporter [Escherichia coli]|uniref:L-tartrate/succinate antiporter n=1 Tax=Escherichia coli TaxID=562 RepID=UPI0018825796|nr:L-tartrate/succinate antiporter [Escherichia coli]MBE8480859.1 L-tartrate/succinate antiporter [Escherichia coli]